MELAVIELYGANVLLAAMHGFEFAVALNFLGCPGCRQREPEGKHEKQEHNPDEEIALFGGVLAADWSRVQHAMDDQNAVSGRICVLL